MVTIISICNPANSTIVVYSQQFYHTHFHNGTSWQVLTTEINMEIPMVEFSVSEDFYFEETDFSMDAVESVLLFGQTPEEFFFEFEGPGQSKSENGNTNNSGNHGVINYNFYNQQWQNSLDLEHAMQTESTAYGGAGGGDSSHNSNRWESSQNLLASGMQLASGLLPLLADGLTEDFENSDRVSKVQAGASTLVTQHTTGCRVYASIPEQASPSSAADAPSQAGPCVDRFVTWHAADWVATDPVFRTIYIPLPFDMLTKNTPVASLARRHFLLTCGWHVQVQVNATRFHGGALGVFMAPQFVATGQTDLKGTTVDVAALANFNPQQLFVYPHQILNPRTNSSVEIKVPYANNTPGCDPTQQAPWTLMIVILSPLSYGAGATTSLPVIVSVRPLGAEFHGIRQDNNNFQGLPKNKPDSASFAFSSTQPHYSQPDYGAMVRSSPSFLPAEIKDLLQISSIPTLVQQRAVSFQQTAPTTALLSMNVSLTATDLLNTSLETVSRGFAQYRGSIAIRMVYVGNQMQNVRFVAAYTPPGSDPPTTAQQAMDGIYTIFDTGLNSAHDFVIPYISTTDFRLCNSSSQNNPGSGGYFTIWQLTNLAVPPGSPATAELLIFAASGLDFEWRCPTTPHLQFEGEETQITPAETGVTPALTAANSNQAVVDIPYAPQRVSHSAVRFWFDRFFLSQVVNVPSKTAATPARVPLTWEAITQNIPAIRWFTHATYLRFELEIAIRPWNQDDVDVEMVYYPPGTNIPTGTVDWGSTTTVRSMRHCGPCPRWTWNTKKTPCFTTRVPFCSPASVFTQTYTGWPNWQHTDETFGTTPGLNTFGDLLITNGNGNASGGVNLYISYRFVDIQLWCPRPGLKVEPPTPSVYCPEFSILPLNFESEGMANFDLLALAGDVELNPGPFFMKMARKMEPDLDMIFSKFEMLRDSFKKVTDFGHWMEVATNVDKKKWLKRFIKFLSYGVILTRARHDPMLAAAAAFLLSGDWLAKLCSKIVKWVKEHARTEPPPLPCSDDPEDEPEEGTSKQTQKGKTPRKEDTKKKNPKGLSVNSGDITRNSPEDVPMIDLSQNKLFAEYPKGLNPFGESFMDTLQNEQYIAGLQQQRATGNPFEEEEETGFAKFKKFFKFEGPLQELNQVLVLCRNAHWLGQQLQKVMDWLGIWKKQEEESSEETFRQEMQQYPQMMTNYEAYKNAPRHKEWQVCKDWFDKMRKLCMLHDPKLVSLFPNMVHAPHENSRQEPLLIVLRGAPGQGKSVAAAMLAQMVAHSLTGKPDYYSYNSSTNYFDGYQQQPVVLIDDLGQDPAGTDFSVFCQMISTTPFLPNMASLQDKGIKFTSDVIIATTNLPQFKPVTIADPGALQRRINFDFEVKAGPSYKTSKGTLDLERALQPTGCSAPLHLVKADIHLFSSACLAFKDLNGRCDCSLIEVYDRIMKAHNSRNQLANRLVEIFNFEGPVSHDPKEYSETYRVPIPKKKDVERWCDLAIASEPHDDEVLSFLRTNCDHKIFGAYLRRFYGGGIDPTAPPKRPGRAIEMISLLVQVLALLLMVLSVGVMIWQLFSMEGAYGGNAVKRDKKPNGLKMVDIANFQGPMNFDLEKSLLSKNCVAIGYRGTDGKEQTTGGLMIRGRLAVMNYHLWIRATHLQLDGEWVPRESIPAIRPCANSEPTDVVFMNWARTPGRQYRDITTMFPRACEGHFKLGPQAKVTGICAHQVPSFMFAAEALGTAEKARTWDAVVPMVLKYKAQTAPGFCGSVMVVDNGLWKKVFGIHCAGAHGVGIAAIISQEMLEAVASIGEFQGKIRDVQPHAYIYTPHKTALYPTVACDDKTTVEPAPLSMNDKRLQKPLEFKKTIMAKHIGDRKDGPLAMISAARLYARLIRSKCGNVNERLSLREAVFGTDNLDPMDMSRSPGWPYIGRARRPELINPETLELDPVLHAELATMMEGNFSNHKFVTFLKDELRDKEKVKQGKTRVIDIGSFGHAIMGRVLFGNLAAAMHAKNGVDIGSAVGTNPDIDWTRYAAEFKFENFVDIDYSGFDATHSSFSFHCLKIFLQELGFDQIALNYVDSLCTSTHIWDDEQFVIEGGLPSGCSCTSIFNTIINNIVVRAFVPLVSDAEFQMLAYGDDLVLCSSEKFDVEKYKWLLENLTNYKITPASKTGSFEWTTLGGVVFLKRSFYQDGLLVRPVMTYQNLHNILSYARAGTVQEKLASVARLAQHRGVEDYQSLLGPFEDCGYVVPSFDELELEFFSLFFG